MLCKVWTICVQLSPLQNYEYICNSALVDLHLH
ncbi:hypothetical protein T09_5938 [Trichinella sp. T9]|nr:hypothetical protein T09_5938 [Trichinella sp. T9]